MVALEVDGRKRRTAISRLMCEAFFGPPPTPKHQAAHWNGDPSDNRLENLRWATPAENAADRVRHGTAPRGETHGGKLTRAIAQQIRDEYNAAPRTSDPAAIRLKNGARAAIAKKYGIESSTLHKIVRGEYWAPAPTETF